MGIDKLEEIEKNYPVKEFLSIPPELFILDSICPFCFLVYKNDEKTSERISKGELKFIKSQLRPPASVNIALAVKKEDQVFVINREEAKEIYSPLDTKEKALAFVCLLEEATPIFDLSFLEDKIKNEDLSDIGIYSNIKEGLHPTQIIEEDDYYLINLFFWFVYWTDEILYKVEKMEI